MAFRSYRLSLGRIGLILAAWALLGAVAVGNSLLSLQNVACDAAPGAAAPGPLDHLPEVAENILPPYIFWALVTPGLVLLARRWRLENLRESRVLLVHVTALATVVFASAAYTATLHNALVHLEGFRPDPRWHLDWALIRDNLHRGLLLDVVTYAAVLGIAAAWIYYRDSRERLTEAAQLQASLADARYETLRAKVEPHFLFNTLNTISALAATDPAGTRETVASLSALLRRALDHGAATKVPLREELSFSQHYLEIERRRYGKRLHVEFAIAPDARDLLVPSFLLQPLVENAIRHGTAMRRGPSTVRVEAHRDGDRLRLRVLDDGPGAPDELTRGIGLSSTEARLQELYGPGAEMVARNAEGQGFEVAIALPARGQLEDTPATAGVAGAPAARREAPAHP
ncbi:MAG: histidine kinase [Acidobacteria bacterium]|nr:histidine kinase [Acidobacteriota bacterium]